jgi:hypothetical protein
VDALAVAAVEVLLAGEEAVGDVLGAVWAAAATAAARKTRATSFMT